ILISTAEELAWVILQSGAAGAGVTYKVADGITAFYMNENTADLTLEQVKNSLGGNNTNAWECQGNAFQGTLDGNGVAIYGLYSVGTTNDTKGAYGALVPTATGNVTVKNIAVKNSYIGGYLYASAIIGYAADGALTALTVEKCVITNNYIYQTRTASSSGGKNYSVGVLGGYISAATESASVTMDNCLIYGNELYSGMPGNISATIARFNTSSANAESGCYKFTNLIISGAAPWCGNFTYWGRYIDNFSNVYSDTDASKFTKTSNTFSDTYLNDETISAQLYCSTSTGKIEIIDNANMQGAAAETNMPNLDWTNTWITIEDNYPALRVFYNATGDDSGDGSEGDEGDDNHTTPDGAWDGTAATSYADGDGTEANPFIIENVAQLYKMVKDGGEDASGNAAYFKVKDGVYDLYANPVEGMTSDEIKAYFADSTTYKAVWDPQTTEFNGTFDGNGVNIHGLYNVKAATSAGVAFLPRVSNSKAFINNVQFSDCYFENTGSFASGTSAAVLVGRSDNSDISFNNVAVCNSTAKCAAYVAAVFVAQNGATVTIDTAFTSGNTLYSEYYYSESLTYTYEGILYGNTSGYLYTIKNSVFTETDEYMSRVHYNVSIKFENSYVAALTASSITGISVSEISQSNMIGASAQTNMPDLDWTTWILTDSYPVIAALHDLTYTTTGDSGHTITCGDCDISISLESHNYNSNYVCTLCAFEHSHTLVDSGIDYDATCVDSGVMNVKCEYCDYTSTREICAKNHIFGEVIAATAGDCQTEATVAYKTCSQCELCFTPEEDVTSINPLDHIGTGYTARHNWVEQTPIEFVCANKTVQYFKCSVCDKYLVEGVMTDAAPSAEGDAHIASGNYEITESNHADICSVCGESYDTQVHTDANSDSICDICGWPCGEHIFDGASITLTDSIAVNYKIKKSVVGVLGYSNLYIKFTFCGNEYTVSEYTEDDTYYVFTFDNIAPHRMSDTIYATFYGTKGDTIYESEKCEYSVRKYCSNMLEKYSDDTELRTLLVDLLNYGAQSQIYTDYNTSDLANAALTEEQQAWATADADVEACVSVKNLEYATVENPTVSWTGGGLYLRDSIMMRFTIQADSISGLTVKVSCGGKEWDITTDNFKWREDGKGYYVYIDGFNATQMREPVYLTVYSGDTAVSNTICYSVASYVAEKQNDSDEKLTSLLLAMIKYGDTANTYAQNQ
ncbi:MAG: hypothetical protein IJY79_08765, partial [Clostridia bacterium]|nr:hypothetical protein [Clostridia bacterium]